MFFTPERIFLLCCLVGGYFFGLIQTAFFISKAKNKDLRYHGSGNLGTTNSWRVLGWQYGVLTFLGDVIKTVIAIFLAIFVFQKFFMSSLNIDFHAVVLYTGVGVVLGHDFPCYLKFKGGKGIACTFATIVCLQDLKLLAVAIIVFLLVFLFSRYVSLASLFMVFVSDIAFILFMLLKWTYVPDQWIMDCEVMLAILFVLAMIAHRTNLVRLAYGEENKFLFRRRLREEQKEEDYTDFDKYYDENSEAEEAAEEAEEPEVVDETPSEEAEESEEVDETPAEEAEEPEAISEESSEKQEIIEELSEKSEPIEVEESVEIAESNETEETIEEATEELENAESKEPTKKTLKPLLKKASAGASSVAVLLKGFFGKIKEKIQKLELGKKIKEKIQKLELRKKITAFVNKKKADIEKKQKKQKEQKQTRNKTKGNKYSQFDNKLDPNRNKKKTRTEKIMESLKGFFAKSKVKFLEIWGKIQQLIKGKVADISKRKNKESAEQPVQETVDDITETVEEAAEETAEETTEIVEEAVEETAEETTENVEESVEKIESSIEDTVTESVKNTKEVITKKEKTLKKSNENGVDKRKQKRQNKKKSKK